MLRQIYIINIKAVNPIFQEAYLANAFINPKKISHIFNKIDLLLEY